MVSTTPTGKFFSSPSLWRRIVIVDDSVAVHPPCADEKYSLLSAFHQTLQLVTPYVYPEFISGIRSSNKEERIMVYKQMIMVENEKTQDATSFVFEGE